MTVMITVSEVVYIVVVCLLANMFFADCLHGSIL